MTLSSTSRGRRTGAAACLLAAALAVAACHPAEARTAVAYPTKSQSARQQDRDRYECHDWARGQSGFDPSQPAPAASAPTGTPSAAAGRLLRGAAGGAALGELVRHDAGQGAAVGVLGAGLRERLQGRQAATSNEAARQQAARDEQRRVYERAFAACMQARDYVVK